MKEKLFWDGNNGEKQYSKEVKEKTKSKLNFMIKYRRF